jgi:putative ABC transport system substrate-binding protein
MALAASPTFLVPSYAFSQSSEARRIAWFSGSFIGIKELRDAYEHRLAERGWRNGREITIRPFDVPAGSEIPLDQRQELAIAKMLEWRPAMIVVTGNVYSRKLKQTNINVPVVFHLVSDPVAAGLVASLPRPAGNYTGVTTSEDLLATKRLQLARELLPAARRIAVVYSEENEPFLKNILVRMGELASKLKFELAMIDLRRRGQTVNEMLSRIRSARSEAIIPVGELFFNDPTDPKFVNGMKALLDVQHKAPFIDNDLQSVESGFLVAIGELETDRLRALADITSKILNGTKPALIPVDEATKIQVWVNLKTAKAIGITIPQSILVRADRVIE